MPIDNTRQVNASVVMTKELYERLQKIAVTNKRSVSKQILFWVEKQIEIEEQSNKG